MKFAVGYPCDQTILYVTSKDPKEPTGTTVHAEALLLDTQEEAEALARALDHAFFQKALDGCDVLDWCFVEPVSDEAAFRAREDTWTA